MDQPGDTRGASQGDLDGSPTTTPFGERPATGLPAIRNVPDLHYPNFIRRAAVLRSQGTDFEIGRLVTFTALCGIGTTQLATAHAYRQAIECEAGTAAGRSRGSSHVHQDRR